MIYKVRIIVFRPILCNVYVIVNSIRYRVVFVFHKTMIWKWYIIQLCFFFNHYCRLERIRMFFRLFIRKKNKKKQLFKVSWTPTFSIFLKSINRLKLSMTNLKSIVKLPKSFTQERIWAVSFRFPLISLPYHLIKTIFCTLCLLRVLRAIKTKFVYLYSSEKWEEKNKLKWEKNVFFLLMI